MKRLTAPAYDRGVYAWYNRHRPPAALRSRTDGTPPEGAKVEVSTRPGRTGQSIVRVRITNPKQAPEAPAVEMTWVWAEAADAWYFIPPAR
jgi:hypothetical protein